MSTIRVIVFDFDGVILDSVPIKTRAFAALFQERGPEVVHQVIHYHENHGGISRFEKFRYIYREILREPLGLPQEKALGDQFNKLIFDGVLGAPYICGAPDLIRAAIRKWPLYIASGTPEGELRTIAEKRGISQFFAGVFGSPKTKGKILMDIIECEGVMPQDVLFVGDAMTDFDAAMTVKTQFVGLVTPEAGHSPFPVATQIVTDHYQLLSLLDAGLGG